MTTVITLCSDLLNVLLSKAEFFNRFDEFVGDHLLNRVKRIWRLAITD